MLLAATFWISSFPTSNSVAVLMYVHRSVRLGFSFLLKVFRSMSPIWTGHRMPPLHAGAPQQIHFSVIWATALAPWLCSCPIGLRHFYPLCFHKIGRISVTAQFLICRNTSLAAFRSANPPKGWLFAKNVHLDIFLTLSPQFVLLCPWCQLREALYLL